jgi:polar amino acid transport system substrate-binding protein
MYKFLASLFCAICFSGPLIAQSLLISTVTRPPFSLVQNDKDVGFSIELWEAIAKDLGTDFTIKRHENF